MTPQELKNSILQLAIQGKLVEPNIRDFPVDLSAIKQKKLMNMNLNFRIIGDWRILKVLQKISHPKNTRFLNLRY